MRILLLLLATTVIPPTPSPHQSERIVHLEDSLLAPCCYTQPVSKHMSDIAFDMRREISEMVLDGKSDREILDHYKALYGLQILVDPEGTRHKVCPASAGNGKWRPSVNINGENACERNESITVQTRR